MTSHPVEIRNLGVTISGRPILRDIDLTISSGDVLAVLGANGSGKSTLIKAMLGLIPSSVGDISLYGEPLSRFRSWGRIGYVPQRSALSQGVVSSAREVVSSGRLSRRKPFRPPSREDREAVENALSVVGLADRGEQPMSTLSGGQQQRVLIARALAGQPDLLIMDEPNAGVDLINQQAIANTLRSLAESGTTLVLVLHELGPFQPWIQRCLVVSEGRVAYSGTADSAPRIESGTHHHRPEPVPPSAHEGLIRGGS